MTKEQFQKRYVQQCTLRGDFDGEDNRAGRIESARREASEIFEDVEHQLPGTLKDAQEKI